MPRWAYTIAFTVGLTCLNDNIKLFLRKIFEQAISTP